MKNIRLNCVIPVRIFSKKIMNSQIFNISLFLWHNSIRLLCTKCQQICVVNIYQPCAIYFQLKGVFVCIYAVCILSVYSNSKSTEVILPVFCSKLKHAHRIIKLCIKLAILMQSFSQSPTLYFKLVFLLFITN